MDDLDLGSRLGRIEAKLDALSAALLSEHETSRLRDDDHEKRLRFLEKFTYGATGVLTVAVALVGFIDLYLRSNP